jgi:flagellar motor switch protein FliN/FliY
METAAKKLTQKSNQKPVDAPEQAKINRALIDDVEVSLEAWLGEAKLKVADLSALSEGSVIPLQSGLNQAVELRLNGVSIARGELVAVGDRFGVRLTELAK